MIRLIAFAAFAFAMTTSAYATTIAPVHEPDSVITQAAYGCGPFRTRLRCLRGGTTVRQARRHYRRCARWHGGACVRFY